MHSAAIVYVKKDCFDQDDSIASFLVLISHNPISSKVYYN